jgi:cobalt-zinc-cadmium efflux system protein
MVHQHHVHDEEGLAGHSHAHGHGQGASERRLGIAALLTGVFMLAEVAGGLVSGSLALLADAGHMLTDFASLGLAWFGFRLARRPGDWQRTYGYDRFSVLAAFVNGLTLFAVAIWIVVEAWHRLGDRTEVIGGVMLAVALAGLAVNLVVYKVLMGGDRQSLNVRAALLHVAGDLLGSVAALAAAVVIMATGWTPIDPLLSVLVALIILRSAWRVVGESGHILLEGVPRGQDGRAIAADLAAAVAGVANVHHVHAWSINENRPMVTLHARVTDNRVAPEVVIGAIKRRLREQFGIAHATVEIEFEACADDPHGSEGVSVDRGHGASTRKGPLPG